MGLLDLIGLTRKRPRPVGKTLEKGRSSGSNEKRTNLIVKIVIITVLVLGTLAAFPRRHIYEYTVDVDTEWLHESVVAPFSFSIYKDEAILEAEQRAIRYTTPPIFTEIRDASARLLANRDTVTQQLQRVFDAYASFQFHKMRGRIEDATADSIRYNELRRASRLTATTDQWNYFVTSYIDRMPGLSSASREPVEGRRPDEQLLQQSYEIAVQLIQRGVLDVEIESIYTDHIIVRDDIEHGFYDRRKESLYGLSEAHENAQRHFQNLYGEEPILVMLGSAVFRTIFSPSLTYMRGETEREYQRMERRISPTRGRVNQGQTIVRQGQIVTEEIKRMLTSLERTQAEMGGVQILWRLTAGQFLVTLSTFLIFFVYLYLMRRQIFDDNKKVLLLSLLFGGIIGLFAIAIRVPSVAVYAVPVAIAPVVLTVIFDSRVGLFGAMTLALIGGQLLNYNYEFTFATIFATSLGVFSVRDIKNRGQFFITAGLVLIGYLVILGATFILYELSSERILSDILQVSVNSFLLILAYPLLWVFERSFDLTTDLTLLELSDTNRPLLKELSIRAPGTFNHVLQVANLSEAAADAIGANALLARVGALYHDIGKMLKPEYFIENQHSADNPHEQLKPRMSALIIASHVKEGLEMGRKYKLPQRILEFIPMHHGTTRIEFFYRKAVDLMKEKDPVVFESEFRYPGPRPSIKETGIVMLADSIEAASRSLTEPTHKRLEGLIESIFKKSIESGELNQSDLTFKDLSVIKETFLSMLLGIYHVRVKYPDQEEETPTVQEPSAGETGDLLFKAKIEEPDSAP